MKKERKRRERSEDFPPIDLCYHQGLRSIHTICVCMA
jgi:hypothetical protein